jgi:hypothetical protein
MKTVTVNSYQILLPDGLKDSAENARLSRKHRLFVVGWTMGWDYNYIISADKTFPEGTPSRYRKFCSTLLSEDVPIASLIYLGHNNCLKVFVRKKMRRLGIGSILTHTFTTYKNIHNIQFEEGIIGADVFFTSLEIGATRCHL